MKQVFKFTSFWCVAALYILIMIPDFFIKSHLISYVIDQRISAADGARCIGLIAGMSIIGRVVMGWIAERLGWVKSFTVTCFIASASIIWLEFVTNTWGLYLFAVVYGFFWGSSLSLLSCVVSLFFGLATLSELLGFLLGLGVLIGAIAPFLGGWISDLTGSYLLPIAFAAIFLHLRGYYLY